MSNRRKPRTDQYRRGYLHSPAWFTRRTHWFTTQQRRTGRLTCAGCGLEATRGQLELHHLDYTGVTLRSGRWVTGEKHDELIALHPYCHELLHRLIDRDKILARQRTRRDANLIALTRLRPRLEHLAAKEVGS